MPRDERLDVPPTEAAQAAAQAIFECRVVETARIEEGVNALYRIELEDRIVVLKAPTIATDEAFLAEPALLRFIGQETLVPTPQVLAQGAAEAEPLDTAFYVMEFIEGRQIQSLVDLSPPARKQLVQQAGTHLAAIHDLRITDTYGHLYFRDDELGVKSSFQSWDAFFTELVEEMITSLLGEGHLTDKEPRFVDLASTIRKTLTEYSVTTTDSSPAPALVISDYRPLNLVLASDEDTEQLIQGVIDVSGLVGDPLLDVAMTEEALIDTPLGGTASAESLRTVFRTAYAKGRDSERESLFDERYPYYRLYARAERLAAFDYTAQFARETDPESIANRWRSFVADRVDEIDERRC
jgi:aminoglycoside phosphotransferase (APT) family kinase protein